MFWKLPIRNFVILTCHLLTDMELSPPTQLSGERGSICLLLRSLVKWHDEYFSPFFVGYPDSPLAGPFPKKFCSSHKRISHRDSVLAGELDIGHLYSVRIVYWNFATKIEKVAHGMRPTSISAGPMPFGSPWVVGIDPPRNVRPHERPSSWLTMC
jgi:hypothetical protein